MRQSTPHHIKVNTIASLAIAVVLPQNDPPFTYVASFTSNSGQNTRQRPRPLYNSPPLSLDAIIENPSTFPNTNRILGDLSHNVDAENDYREFLTVLSQEWRQYSKCNLEQRKPYEDETWFSRNITPSSSTIATTVGTVSGYATMQGLNYVRHDGAFGQEYPSEFPYEEQYFASVSSSSDKGVHGLSRGCEPHTYLVQDHNCHESSSNVLRDLAQSLPPPVEHYNEAGPYYDDSLQYVSDSSTGIDMAAGNLPDVSDVSDVTTSILAAGDTLQPAIKDASVVSTNSLSSQLSEITYAQSFNQAGTVSKRIPMPHFSKISTLESPSAKEAISKVKEFATYSMESINHALAKDVGSSQLNHLFGSLSHSFESLPGRFASIGSSSAESFGKAVHELEKMKMPQVQIMPTMDMTREKMPSVPPFSSANGGIASAQSIAVEGSKTVPSTHMNFADTSLADIGNSVLRGIEYLGGTLFGFLNWMIGAVFGTSLSQILSSVQTSLSNLIDNATSSALNLLSSLGNLTIKEILEAFLTILLVITDVIMKVLNALVYLISGKDAAGWALQASSAANNYGTKLLAQAGSTYQDVTHKSLGELAMSIGDYSHHVGEELLAVINTLSAHGGVQSVMDNTGGDVSYLSAENLEQIATSVHTALAL